MEGPEGKLDLTLETVNKPGVVQQKQHDICNLEVQ